MINIKNLKEKRLLVSRKMIVDTVEPTNENILSVWGKMCYSDKDLIDAELIEWIRKCVTSNGIKSCNKLL